MQLVGHCQIGWPIQITTNYLEESIRRFIFASLIMGLLISEAAHAQDATNGATQQASPKSLGVPKSPAPPVGQQPLPTNPPTALQLANAQAIDVAVASQ